eukprot:3532483-Amphidinium_carterae.1
MEKPKNGKWAFLKKLPLRAFFLPYYTHQARKSDIVANYLGIRACQAMIRKLDVMHEELAKNVDKACNAQSASETHSCSQVGTAY